MNPRFEDLLCENLAHMSGYLLKTTRLLFAVAVTAPTCSWLAMGKSALPTDKSQAILSCNTTPPPHQVANARVSRRQIRDYYVDTEWSIFDTRDLRYAGESVLAQKLSEDDLAAAFLCTNAKRTLKCVRLQGNVPNSPAFGVRAFVPLSGSAILEEFSINWRPEDMHTPNEMVAFFLGMHSGLRGPGAAAFLRSVKIPIEWTVADEATEPSLRDFFSRRHAAIYSFFRTLNVESESDVLSCDHCGSDWHRATSHCYLCNECVCDRPQCHSHSPRQCFGCDTRVHEKCSLMDGPVGTPAWADNRRFVCQGCGAFYCDNYVKDLKEHGSSLPLHRFA